MSRIRTPVFRCTHALQHYGFDRFRNQNPSFDCHHIHSIPLPSNRTLRCWCLERTRRSFHGQYKTISRLENSLRDKTKIVTTNITTKFKYLKTKSIHVSNSRLYCLLLLGRIKGGKLLENLIVLAVLEGDPGSLQYSRSSNVTLNRSI